MTTSEQSFFITTGEGTYRATGHTAGPWDPGLQHGGPPSALLARELRRLPGAEGLSLARITFELLGPIPVGDVTIAAEVVRPGKRVRMLEATLEAGGRTAIRARAWQIAQGGAEPVGGDVPGPALPDTETIAPPPWDASGYIQAMEWRYTHGGYDVLGPSAVWARPRYPLVDDEPLDGLSCVLLLADSANGISGPLDITSWYFIPPETTIHVLREPEPGWVHLDAETVVAENGPGITSATASDARGTVAYGRQALLVAPR